MRYDVISVGGANIDVFITSKSKDIEFEKIHEHEDVCLPIGAKILIDNLVTDTGGSGLNTSTAFARLGFKAAVISKLGEDMNAEIILNKLKKEKVDFLGVKAPGHTGYSVIFSGLHKNRTILTFKGNNNNLTTKDIRWKKLKTKWLYFGTLLGESWKTQCEIASYAKKNGIKLLFNPSLYLAEKGMKFLRPVLDACTILVLNKEEAEALTGMKADTKTLLGTLQETVPIVVITDGPRGAQAYNGIKYHSIVPKDVPIIDTTGAGDSFASAFLAALLGKQDIPTALRWGAAEANSVIQHYGATNKLLTKKEMLKQAKHAEA
ncbi:MAG: carbohydrate kinase family protein [Candidatus Woesearchaeota archaeon]